MTERMNMDLLKRSVFFETATFDDRYTWAEIVPVADPQSSLLIENPGLTDEQITAVGLVGILVMPGEAPRWADGQRRYRITGCAHKAAEDGYCLTCGEERS